VPGFFPPGSDGPGELADRRFLEVASWLVPRADLAIGRCRLDPDLGVLRGLAFAPAGETLAWTDCIWSREVARPRGALLPTGQSRATKESADQNRSAGRLVRAATDAEDGSVVRERQVLQARILGLTPRAADMESRERAVAATGSRWRRRESRRAELRTQPTASKALRVVLALAAISLALAAGCGGDDGSDTSRAGLTCGEFDARPPRLEARIERQEQLLDRRPRSQAALGALVRDYHALASVQLSSGSLNFPKEAKDELRCAARAWQRYLEVEDGEPDASLARLALTVYDQGALAQPEEAVAAMRIVAEAGNDYESYLGLVQRAAVAGDTRTADLAAQKAVELAPEGLKKQVRQVAKQLQTPPEPVPAEPEQTPTPPEP
jgi:hypothetical protein